jgi:hypothetical protein
VDDYEANHRVFKITMQINKAVVDSKKIKEENRLQRTDA